MAKINPKKSGNKKKSLRQTKKKPKQKQRKQTKLSSATFVANTKTPDGYQRFDKIKSLGWINEPVLLGVLTNVREGAKGVVFEFDLEGYKFDAWSGSSKGWNLKNKALLKVDHSYVIQGTMLGETKKKKFSKASNSDSPYTVMLAEISVIEEKHTALASNKEASLMDMNQRIQQNKTFTLQSGKLKVIAGEVRRYMGCKTCHAGMSQPRSTGKFYCKICKKTVNRNERKVCMIIRNLEVRDVNGIRLSNAVCFHKQCETLFGDNVVDDLCKSDSDLTARDKFEQCVVGKFITATIKHQRIKADDYRIVVENIKNLNETQASPDNDNGWADDDPTEYSGTRSSSENQRENAVCYRNDQPVYRFLKRYDKFFKLTYVDGHIGLALVINITKTTIPGSQRTGSKHNVRRLMAMFSNLKIRVYENKAFDVQTENELKGLITGFKNELIRKNYSSLFFVFMSHGQLYAVQLGDSTMLSVHGDILPFFSEEAFEEFAEKPKIFIFQACQVFGTKPFVVSDTQVIPERLECYSVGPGIKSKRKTKDVSPFIAVIAEIFETYKSTWHIEEMMKAVQERMRKIPLGLDGNVVNIANYKPVLFSKRFYFAEENVVNTYLLNLSLRELQI